ncbi:MAG: Ni/Fe hydrogenase subunit alpha [Candidatus Woesearchaeota archaeon]
MAKTINLNHITKIEGHASLELSIDSNKVTKCELSAIEGSRYFEGLVVGRKYSEAHEMTSRICGICSCAHVITAISAIEDALGHKPSKQTKNLRILLTLGERIRSHATHLYFLALPDYLGYESAIAMAPKYKDEILTALKMMKIGNKTVKVIGGRDLHPVSATVGGWLKLPSQDQLDELKTDLESIKDYAEKTCKLFFSLKHPDFETKGNFFSLKDDKEYAVLDGDFHSKDSSFKKSEYKRFISESQEPRSTANFVVKDDIRYTVGALSRINNSQNQLSNNAKKMIELSKIKFPSKNPFHNNIAQAIELVHCIDHAIDICENLKIKPEEPANLKPRAGNGVGAIEVPRGTLWHEYRLDKNGVILKANIITPTAQNLLNIQEDIRDFVPVILEKTKDQEKIVLEIEKLIRSYDPCFSCSAHFLEVKWV